MFSIGDIFKKAVTGAATWVGTTIGGPTGGLGTAGGTNTGGGGGGNGNCTPYGAGTPAGAGGSGIVIIRYKFQ